VKGRLMPLRIDRWCDLDFIPSARAMRFLSFARGGGRYPGCLTNPLLRSPSDLPPCASAGPSCRVTSSSSRSWPQLFFPLSKGLLGALSLGDVHAGETTTALPPDFRCRREKVADLGRTCPQPGTRNASRGRCRPLRPFGEDSSGGGPHRTKTRPPGLSLPTSLRR